MQAKKKNVIEVQKIILSAQYCSANFLFLALCVTSKLALVLVVDLSTCRQTFHLWQTFRHAHKPFDALQPAETFTYPTEPNANATPSLAVKGHAWLGYQQHVTSYLHGV